VTVVRTLSLAALLLTGCAVTPRLQIKDPPPNAKPATVDWDKAGDEAVQVLAEYIRVNTANPPGRETLGAEFLAEKLKKEGIDSEIIEFAPGRGSLIARLPPAGTPTDKPLCLLSHIDVVNAEADKWPKDKGPFSGAIDSDGMLWGRGALDMKGLGALELMTMIWLKRLNVPLNREVVLVAVADEEEGNGGMLHLVNKHWDKLNCGHLVNEGGIGIKDLLFEGQTVYAVSVAEKGLLWLKMIASGNAGHGSTELPGRAPERLLNAIAKLKKRPTPPSVHTSLVTLLREVGAHRGGATGYVMSRPTLVNWFVVDQLLGNPATKAGITNTCQITGFSGGSEPNVVPSEVTATLDCRLLPGVKPAQLLAELQKLVDDPNVRFQVIQTAEANESPWDDPFFSAIARHAQAGRPDVVVGPVLSPGFTDSLHARPKGTRAYGFVPFEVTKEEAATMHGANERVSVANVKRGLKTLFGAVLEVVQR
jgi:acetylornithine deacetylase/succinyl-diaminopimelate desuccinylase-like protein